MDAVTIYEHGRPAGTLTARREGLYTVWEARLPPAPGLSRLYIRAEGGDWVCLGLLEPRKEGRVFSRRMSRAELAKLPRPIVSAATSDETRFPALPPDAGAPAKAPDTLLPSSSPRKNPDGLSRGPHSSPSGETRFPALPPDAGAPAKAPDTLLPSSSPRKNPDGLSRGPHSSPSGEGRPPAPLREGGAPEGRGEFPSPRVLSLEGKRYLALPAALRRRPAGLRLRRVEGQDYLLFLLEEEPGEGV